MNPFLSVCIPVLNGSNFLSEAIESVLRQTSGDWELCISDNCSNDKTQTICEGFAARDARVRYSRTTARIPVGANWDRAAKMARGTWFLMLGHDDLLEPTALATLQSTASRHPSSRIIIAAPLLIDARGRPLEKQRGALRQFKDVKTLSTSAFLDLLVEGMVCAPTGMFFSRSLLDEFGGFRHDLRGCADYEFVLRVCAGSDVTVVPFPLASYRIHDNQDVRSYVLDQEKDPELLQECMLQYNHLNEEHWREILNGMANVLCRSVALRFVSVRGGAAAAITSYRHDTADRLAGWRNDPHIGPFMPAKYPTTPKLKVVWWVTACSPIAAVTRPLFRAFQSHA